MDRFEIKLNEINEILSKNQLGLIYDFINDRDNGLVLPFFSKYMDSVQKLDLDFLHYNQLTFSMRHYL